MTNDELASLIDNKIAAQAKEAATEGDDTIIAAMTVKSEMEQRLGKTLGGKTFVDILNSINELVAVHADAVRRELRPEKAIDKAMKGKITDATEALIKANLRTSIGLAATTILDRFDLATTKAERQRGNALRRQAADQ